MFVAAHPTASDTGQVRRYVAVFDGDRPDAGVGASHVPVRELDSLRRGQSVVSAAGFEIGRLDGVIEWDGIVTHLVLHPGHEFGGRDIALPIGRVRFDADPLRVVLSRAAIAELPAVTIYRSARRVRRERAPGAVFRLRRPTLPRQSTFPRSASPGDEGGYVAMVSNTPAQVAAGD